MLLRATLFLSFLGVSLANLPTPDNAQCPLITQTYTGPGVWLPTAGAVIPSASQTMVGSWNGVLGQGNLGSYTSGSNPDQKSTSKSRVTNWGNWDSQSTLPAFIDTTQLNGDSTTPSARPAATSATSSTIMAGEPFIMYITGQNNDHSGIIFVKFEDKTAIACDSQQDATLVLFDTSGRLITYSDTLVVGSSTSGTSAITLAGNSSSTISWSLNQNDLQVDGAAFCLASDQSINMFFGQVPNGCTPVKIACDKYCTACTSPSSSSTTTSQTSTVLSTSTLKVSNDTQTTTSTGIAMTTTSTFNNASITSSSILTTSTASTISSTTTTTTSITPLVGTNSSTVSNSTTTNSSSLILFPNNSTTDENGTTTAISGPIDLGSAPQVNLSFLLPPDIDLGSLDRFVAVPSSNLWFGAQNADGSTPDGAVTVRVAMNYSYPSVVLDHSTYITDISCSSTTISGRINDTAAFQKAQAEWTQNPLLFITSTPSCVPDGESAFFLLASGVSFGTYQGSFIASGTAAELSDVIDSMAADFGNIDYTPPTSNSTSNSTSSCGTPSSSTVQGLPAASCDQNFDQTLNDALGYYSANGDEQYVLGVAAPGANSTTKTRRLRRSIAEYPTLERRKKSKVAAVFHAIGHAVEKGVKVVAKAVSTGVTKAAEHIGAAIKSDVSALLKGAGDLAKKAIKATINFGISALKNGYKIAKFLVTGDYSNTFKLPITMGPKPALLVDSPWGDAFKVLEWKPTKGTEFFKVSKTALDKIASSLVGEPNPEPGVELYCVDCEVNGKFSVTGSIHASPKDGWTKGTIDMSGKLSAGLFIGINAFAQYEKNYEVVLFTQFLPGWSIPGIIGLGPQLSLGVSADLNISAAGQLMTGAKLTWDSMAGHIDLLNHAASSQSGWRPTVDHKFDVAGTLSAEAGLGLAVEIGVGILVLKKYGRSIALRDTPAIAADASLSADYNVTTGLTVGNDECPGIDWSVGFENKVTLGFKKQTKKGKEEVELEDGPQYTLTKWNAPPLAHGCIKLGAGGGSDKESGETKQPPVNDTCSYWSGGKQWTDPRSNKWVFLCDVAATQLTNRRLINTFNSTSMLDCFSTCHFDNQQCEQAVFLQDQQKCGWMVTATCDPADATCAASGSMLTTCTAGVDCPSGLAQTFDAVSMPVSPFTIYSASYKQVDITSQVQAWWNKGHWISTQYVDELYLFPQIGDPAPGDTKTYYMFYSYNGEYRSFASKVTTKYNIQAGPIQYPQAQRVTPDPEVYRLAAVNNGYSAASWLRIYDYNFGTTPIPLSHMPAIMDYWYSHLSGATQIMIELAAFDNYDSYYGYNKDGAVYFSSFVKTPGVIGYAQNTESSYIQESVFNPPAGTKKRSPFHSFGRRLDNSTTTDTTSLNTTTPTNTTVDFNFAILTDASGDLTLQLGIDGNLWLSTTDVDSDDIANLTTGEYLIGVQQPSEQILGDSAGNLLHYFPDELSVTGVSRLRLAPWNKLPKTSQIVSLVNMNGTDVDDQVMVAVDTQGSYAWIWVCTYMDQLNKVFLTNSPMNSSSAFTTQTIEWTVTGANATECNPLTLTPSWSDDSV